MTFFHIRAFPPAFLTALLIAGCAGPSPYPSPSFSPLPSMTPPKGNPGSRLPGAPPASALLTVEQAILRAHLRNPQLRSLDAAVKVARLQSAAATDLQDPEALAGFGNFDDEDSTRSDNSGKSQDWQVGVRFYVPNPFVLGPRASAGRAGLMAARADLQAASWLVECDVRRWFAEVNYLTRDLELADKILIQNTEILKDVRARLAAGAATAADVTSATQKQLQAEHQRELVRRERRTALRELSVLLDLPQAALLLNTNGPANKPSIEAPPPKDTLLQAALDCRGDVVALHWRALAARSHYEEERSVRIPWFQKIVAWNKQPSEEWSVNVAVNLPIFSWSKNRAPEAALAESELASTEESNVILLARQEVTEALDELEEQRLEWTRNEQQVVPMLKEMRRTLELLERTRGLTRADVAATEMQFLEASRIEMGSRWRHELALLNLERALGRPLHEVLKPSEGTR
jgi:outer membrane protein TolC